MTSELRRRRPIAALTIAAAAVVAGAAAIPAPAAASGAAVPAPLCPLGLTAGGVVTPQPGHPFIVCSGRVRSFDGTPLDADVSIPTGTASAPRPLMMMLHGWGNDKTEWESTSLAGTGSTDYHWNNAWFVAHGYVVLTYTARGFHRSCGKDASGYTYVSDPMCRDTHGEASWTHLADRRWEVHDLQYMAGLLADSGVIDPQRVAVTGGSYGGGQSWDLALAQDRIVTPASADPKNPVTVPWTSPRGTPMHLVAAAPMYPWTDLADALLQNGRASDGAPGGPADGPHQSPIGVDKQSYVDGLYADGTATAQYATPGADPTADLTTWFSAINAGEPYGANPAATQALAQIGGAFRSPYAMPVPTGAAEVPVFVIQGQTDPLFDAFQALDMVNRLKAVDRSWPVVAFLGDVGHSYANNPPDIWQQAHKEGMDWLSAVMNRTTPPTPPMTVTTTACMPGQTHVSYRGLAYTTLSRATAVLAGAPAQATVSSNNPTVEGANTDPIATSGCRTMAAAQSDPNQATYSWAAPTGTLLGAPAVSVDVAVTGTSAEVAARLWEVTPSGQQTLVTRTVYRIEDSGPVSHDHLLFQLWPQAWQLTPGDQLKLELTQDDSPVWRPDNLPSSLSFTNLQLSIPLARH